MKNRILALILGFFPLFTGLHLHAQDKLVKVSEESIFSIEGTSTLHNWTVEVPEIEGKITLTAGFLESGLPAQGTSIEKVTLKVPVIKLDGGKEVMNNKMHKALLEESHPEIIYELIHAEVTQIDEAESMIELNTRGNITIAGVTQPMDMVVKGKKHADDKYEFTGSCALKMTDFKIDPPSAMFGQIQTGDEITVSYTLITEN